MSYVWIVVALLAFSLASPGGPTAIIPPADVLHRASLRVGDAVKSVVAIERVGTAINQVTQTILRKVVGQHTLDETLSGTDQINADIKVIFGQAEAESVVRELSSFFTRKTSAALPHASVADVAPVVNGKPLVATGS